MNVLDLFSGIGGFSLGLERAGMRTVAFCEIEPYCRAVLRKHWPNVPVYEDVRTVSRARLTADGIFPDCICGGFPCQDISLAGEGRGLEGARSGLWREYLRIIAEYPEAIAIIENVSALRHRGLGTILRQLAEIGRDAEWHCIPASAIGASHRRDRLWIVAHPEGIAVRAGLCASDEGGEWRGRSGDGCGEARAICDTDMQGRQEQCRARPILTQLADAECSGWWRTEPDVGRVADGIPNRVDRLTALGNAVVPQIPELIGRAIMKQDSNT